MSTYSIQLTREQVGVLFEMCEFCTSAIHRQQSQIVDDPPESFILVNSIQSLLDFKPHPPTMETLMDAAELTGTPWKIQEFQDILQEWRHA